MVKRLISKRKDGLQRVLLDLSVVTMYDKWVIIKSEMMKP